MPSTRGSEQVCRALRSYAEQTYPCKELVVLRCPHPDLTMDTVIRSWEGHGVRLELVPPGLSIGELRNIACRVARGSVLFTVDDDDVSHPDRLARSMAAIDQGADLVGSSRVIYTDGQRRWLYDGGRLHYPQGLVGGTLVYRRRLWERHNFEDVRMGEDTRFLALPRPASTVVDLADETLYTATISPDATSPKDVTGTGWSEL